MRPACASRCGIAGSDGTMHGASTFDTPDGAVSVEADATVLALGGASWPRLGSDGGWADMLDARRRRGRAAAAVQLRLPGRLVGASSQPLRRAAAEAHRAVVRRSCGARRGDHHPAAGLEGGAIYALSAPLRDAIAAHGEATLRIALRPDMRPTELERRLDVAARQAVALDLPAQGAQPVAGRDRPAAGGDGAASSPHARCRRARAR